MIIIIIIIIILITSITCNVPDDCRLDTSKSMYVSYLFDEYPSTLPIACITTPKHQCSHIFP